MGRFVDSAQVVRYTLADGEDWVEFRKELSYAESQKVEAGALRGKVDQSSQELDIDIDWAAYGVSRLAGWVVDWSFTDQDGSKEPVTAQSIGLLNQATAEELGGLLDKHLEGLEADPGKAEAS